ncbi:hypothetical protein DM56_4556 [Burkholderia mallei]|nr:hypothetical protein DM56_4556 [Burkholderia mallei]
MSTRAAYEAATRGVIRAAGSLLKFKPCQRVPIASTSPTSS